VNPCFGEILIASIRYSLERLLELVCTLVEDDGEMLHSPIGRYDAVISQAELRVVFFWGGGLFWFFFISQE